LTVGIDPLAHDMIRLQQLTKHFGGTYALRGVNLHIPAGEMWGLLGPNGAGKTTLFRILMGILKPSFGTATVAGLDAFDDRIAVKRVLGYLPDEPMFHSYLTGREILELSASMHGLEPASELSRLGPLIARMQLTDALGQFADDYSRGMKKKLGLLLALVHQPRLLVLDEPTNGLDVESTALFFELIREQQASGTTVVFSTHLLGQVEALCSHVAVIHRGKLVASGELSTIAGSVAGAGSLEQVFLQLTKQSAQEERMQRALAMLRK
jgi:ABC-type multidrug transport system ATPase subunit